MIIYGEICKATTKSFVIHLEYNPKYNESLSTSLLYLCSNVSAALAKATLSRS